MFWVILIVVIIAICAFKAWLNDDSSSSSTSAPPAPAWREPSTPDEHLVLLAIVANQLGKYGYGDDKLTEVNMQTHWSWGFNRPDRVSVTLRGIDATSVLSDSKAWQYLKSQSTDGTSVKWTFEFDPSKGGAPGHYRGEEWTLQFIRQFAPQAYSCGISHSSSDDSWICFGKNDLYLRDIDAEVVRAYTSYRKY